MAENNNSIESQKNPEARFNLPSNPEQLEYFDNPKKLDSRYTQGIMDIIDKYGDNIVSHEYSNKTKTWTPAYYEWSMNRDGDAYALKKIGDDMTLIRKRDGKYLATKLEIREPKKEAPPESNITKAHPELRNDAFSIAEGLSYKVIGENLGLSYSVGNIALDIPLNKINAETASELKNYIGSLVIHAETQRQLGDLRNELPYRNDKTDIKIDNHMTDFADTTALSAKRLSELMPQADIKELETYAKKLSIFMNQIYKARQKN